MTQQTTHGDQSPGQGRSRREFVLGAMGVGLAAATSGGLLAACSGGKGGEGAAPVEDAAAVKGGPKTTLRKDVIYPDGYVGPMAADKGKIVVGKEKVTLKVVVPKSINVADWNKNAMTTWYEERTGVHVEFQAVGVDGQPAETMTKVNAMITAGEIPDIFMNINFSNAQLLLYGQQGLFLPLEKYIADYGVEIKKVYKDYPETEKAITAPDGHVYSMPYVNDCYHCAGGNQRMWVYKPWLDKLGLKKPQTLEEFRDMLVAFKTRDPNGNGKNDEAPLMGESTQYFTNYFMGSFLYAPADPWLAVDESGKVELVASKDGWREGLRYINSLYKDGLIAKESLTQNVDQLRRLGDKKGDRILGAVRAWDWGSFLTIDDDSADAAWRDYETVPTLEGPDGTRIATWSYYEPGTGGFVVTKNCKNPAVATMWADGQYELEAQMRSYSGDLGKHWRWAKQGEIGINGKQAIWTSLGTWPPPDGTWWGQNGTNYRSNDYRLSEVVDPVKPTFEKPLYENTKNDYFPYKQPKERQLPRLYLNESQAATAAEVATNLTNHVNASSAQFITGAKNIDNDADWQAYVDTITQMGLEAYLATYQEALDTYNK